MENATATENVVSSIMVQTPPYEVCSDDDDHDATLSSFVTVSSGNQFYNKEVDPNKQSNGHNDSANLSDDRRSMWMSQRAREERASMRILAPEESNEVNWLLNVFDPNVSDIREVHNFY